VKRDGTFDIVLPWMTKLTGDPGVLATVVSELNSRKIKNPRGTRWCKSNLVLWWNYKIWEKGFPVYMQIKEIPKDGRLRQHK